MKIKHSTRFYLASDFARVDEVNRYARQLRMRGYIVECRWLDGAHQLHPEAATIDTTRDEIPIEASVFALDDLSDIRNCDILLAFTDPPYTKTNRGGHHVEFGFALGQGTPVVIIGPRENVFHCMPNVVQFKTWEEFIKELTV